MRNLDVEALRSFVDDNEDLEQLETILARFNLFESLGLVRQEIRHSAFIRWFLDPSETHGWGDFPLRQFLRRVIEAGEEHKHKGDLPSLFDLDNWNLGQAQVLKEWRNIDILILDEENRFVCAIENKVDSDESDGQLKRYKEIVDQVFGGYKKAFVFLTISGYAPSGEAYIPMSYGYLTPIIENTLERRESQANDEIKLFVRQYLEMARRHIVEDSDVQKLCRRLYRSHRRALDLIFEHRPDRATEVAHAIQDYIKSQDDLDSPLQRQIQPQILHKILASGYGRSPMRRDRVCKQASVVLATRQQKWESPIQVRTGAGSSTNTGAGIRESKELARDIWFSKAQVVTRVSYPLLRRLDYPEGVR